MKARKGGYNSENGVPRDPLAISIRAFVPPPKAKEYSRKARKSRPSEWTLVLDIETTTDAEQNPRFGVFQLYKRLERIDSAIFFWPDMISEPEQEILRKYANDHKLRFMPNDIFVDEVFYGIGYDWRATIVCFNQPFALSRLAILPAASARGKAMKNGFSQRLSKKPWWPRIQLKHISARSALKQFTKPARNFQSRGMRKRGAQATERRGSLVDVKTLAAALTSRSFSLKTLADFLQTEHRKMATDEHGGPLTEQYIAYAVQDVQVTWECYVILRSKLEKYGLTQTRVGQILSEATLGKACLREMGIGAWRDVQRDFPNEITGTTMSSYCGGRSEVHLRRMIAQVLYCDFLSMY